jgi:hypothetical protein
MMDRFKVSSPGVRPRRPNSRCERKCDKRSAPVSQPRPAAFPTIGRGRSPGLWDRCVSPSRELALPVAEPRVGRGTPNSGCWLIRPLHLPLRGQQRPWKTRIPDSGRGVSPFLDPRSEPASAPLSRFTPARGTRRDTSNERVDCTTQVAGFYLAAASGIYIENESLHLDLTGFLKL